MNVLVLLHVNVPEKCQACSYVQVCAGFCLASLSGSRLQLETNLAAVGESVPRFVVFRGAHKALHLCACGHP